MSFQVTLPIKAIGKARPRLTRRGIFTPAATKDAEAEIGWLLRKAKAPLFTGPVSLVLAVTYRRPKSSRRRQPTVRPDLDNVLKLVCDAANGILWVDDCQVVHVTAVKQYGAEDSASLYVCEFGGSIWART